MLNINCATGSFFSEHIFRRWANLTIDLPRHTVWPCTASLISSLCRTHGSNDFWLHHSFDLMSSLIDYFFMKSVDKCVVILINLMSSSRISIEFMMRNTILALDELYYHRPLYCLPTNTSLFMFCVNLEIPAIQHLFFFTLEYYHLLISRMLWGLLHLLRNSWYWDASHHHHSFLVPVLSELCCANSKLLATILLWRLWSTFHS